DLTSLAVMYLGTDISPLENELEESVKACRRLVASRAFIEDYGEWVIAREGLDGMPSVGGSGDKAWRNDYWLPRAVAKWTGLPEEHPYWSVLRDYSNADSAVTISLHRLL